MQGCKVKGLLNKTKGSYTTVDEVIRVNRINEERIKTIWIKKIRGVYNIENKETKFNSNIRIIKDSIIIVSIATDFGIEAMRLYFDRDSVTIISRFNKTRYTSSFLEFNAEYGLSFEFDLLEKLLLMGAGEKILYEMKSEMKSDIKKAGYCYVRGNDKRVRKETFCFDYNTGYLRLRGLEVPNDNIKLLIEYSGYEEKSNATLPSIIDTRLKIEGKEQRILLYYDKWVINESFPAKKRISNSYKRVKSLSDL